MELVQFVVVKLMLKRRLKIKMMKKKMREVDYKIEDK